MKISIFLFFLIVSIQVVTIIEKPFIFARPGNDCQSPSEVLCPRKKLNSKFKQKIFSSFLLFLLGSNPDEYEQSCCSGYCIDLLQELSKNLSFVYTLHLVADNKYGSFEKVKTQRDSNESSMNIERLGGR